MFGRSFFEFAQPFYGYGLCNKHNQTGIKFNALAQLKRNLSPLSHKFKGIVEIQ